MKKIIKPFCITIFTLLFFVGCGKQKGDIEYKKALVAIKKGDYIRSRSLLEKSLRKTVSQNKKAIIANQLGITLWEIGDLKLSSEYFRQSVEYSTNFNNSALNYATSLFYEEKIEESEILLNNFLLENPNDVNAQVLLGCIAFKNKKWDDAYNNIKLARENDPRNPALKNIWIITKLFYDKNLLQARGDLHHLVALHPEYLTARLNLAVLYDKYFNDKKLALPHYSFYIENTSSNMPFYQMGTEFIQKINEEKKENTPILTSAEIDVKIRQGKLELTNKNYSEAINIFKKIVESDPDNIIAHYQLGMSYYFLQRHNPAKDSFLNVLKIDKNNADSLYMLAASYIQMRDFDQAEREARKLLKIDKNDAEIILEKIERYRE